MTTASVKQMIKSVSASSIPAKTDGGKFDYFLQPKFGFLLSEVIIKSLRL